jgi:hypothetical protein
MVNCEPGGASADGGAIAESARSVAAPGSVRAARVSSCRYAYHWCEVHRRASGRLRSARGVGAAATAPWSTAAGEGL